jgi:ribosomal protein S18 acetylase RimI-like enzyme
MRRNLRQPLPERPLPAGLILRNYAPELDEGMRQTRNESFSDGWHFDPVSPGDWQRNFVQRFDFRSDLSFAVLAGEEVVAYSMNRFDPIAAERTGLKVGWIGSLGTRRAWRKRGLASALLVASMRAFQAVGLEYAGLGVDAENPTGALSLYEGLGFSPYVQGMQFHKTL